MKKLLFFLFCFSSCVYDEIEPIAILKNETNAEIIVTYSKDSIYTDKKLFYGSKYSVSPYSVQTINGIVYADSLYLFLFIADSVNGHIKLKNENLIFKKSFIKKYHVTINNLHDTIFIK